MTKPIDDLIAASSIGAGLRDIEERGIDPEAWVVSKTRNFATGADDPALHQTSWPLPDMAEHGGPEDVEWQLRYGRPEIVRMSAASIVAAYRALIEDGTLREQQGRLAALRRIQKRRRR